MRQVSLLYLVTIPWESFVVKRSSFLCKKKDSGPHGLAVLIFLKPKAWNNFYIPVNVHRTLKATSVFLHTYTFQRTAVPM